MTYIYNVIREWSQDNGTQVNVLGVYTDLGDAEAEAQKSVRYWGSDEDQGHVGIVRYELNPESASAMNDAGQPVDHWGGE